MAILVDDARWAWRDTTWCHLVSDERLDELHDFARELGCRRVGFQGDHYDIDVDMRSVALRMGATACSSRELVRRLRSAGLRLKPSAHPKWELVARWEVPLGVGDVREALADDDPLLRTFEREVAEEVENIGVDGGFLLGRPGSRALVVFGTSPDPPGVSEQPRLGIYSRIDHRGRWAVEVSDPPLGPSQ